MAHIYRLVIVLSLLVATTAFASFPPTTIYTGGDYRGTSKESACQAAIRTLPLTNGAVSINFTGIVGGLCKYEAIGSNGKGIYTGSVSVGTSTGCTSDASLSGGQCSCNPKYDEIGGACVPECKPGEERKSDGACVKPNPCREPGTIEMGGACVPENCNPGEIRFGTACIPDPDLCPDGSQKVDGKCKEKNCKADQPLPISNSSSMPFALCSEGCIYQTSNAIVCSEKEGVRSCARTYYSTGGTCNDKPSKPGESGGGDNGGDNGGDGGGTGGEGGGSGGGSGGGGGTGGGSGSGDNKPDHKPEIPGKDPEPDTGRCAPGTYMSGGKCYPNKTDEKPTDNGKDDGKCPTGYRKEGSKCIANQPEPDEDKDKEFCKENPEVSICKKGAFDGSCDGSFKCEGDAIQCAIARDQHIRNCQAFDKPNDESKLYDLFKNKTGKQTGDLPGNETFNIGNSIDMSNALGGGSCVQDLTIDVYGASVTLEVSRVCPWLDLLGNILVACALVLAIRIVFRG